MKINDEYTFTVRVNQYAVIEFCRLKKISLERLKDLTGNHFMILSVIVQWYSNESFVSKKINGGSYTFMANSLFYHNVPILFIKNAKTEIEIKKEDAALKRNLQNYLSRLIDFGFISRIIVNEKTRYLKVDDTLLKIYNLGENKLSPLGYLEKYYKNDLSVIRKIYNVSLPPKRYSSIENIFFSNESFKLGESRYFGIDKQNLFNRFETYLNSCVEDPFYEKKGGIK